MKIRTVCIAAVLSCVPAAAWAQAPTDAQIAAIVVTANQVDIDAGKLAESQGSSAAVKAFGKQMVTDHTGVNKQATDLVTKLGVKPEENATSKSLKAGGDDNVIFGGVVTRVRFAAEIDEPVGLARHRRDDDGDLVALRNFARDEFRHGANPLGARHRRAPEFHHDPRHVAPLSQSGFGRNFSKHFRGARVVTEGKRRWQA